MTVRQKAAPRAGLYDCVDAVGEILWRFVDLAESCLGVFSHRSY